MVESAIGLIAPFVIYFVAELIHGSGVIAVVVAALILGQRSAHAGYATRLQDFALWQSVVLILESFAFLLIGLQLPEVISELEGIRASVLIWSSVAVFATVIGVRIGWVFMFAYLPPLLSRRIREREPTPPPAQVFVVAWAGMRGVVSLAAAAGVPLVTLSGDPFPGRPHLVFLTFVVVVGTLLLHGLTLPWVIRLLHVQGDDPQQDRLAAVQAQDRAARAAADRLDELLAESQDPGTHPSVRPRCSGTGTRGASTRHGSGSGARTRRSARVRQRRFVDCDWKCLPPSVRRSSRSATRGASTTRCCARCCTGSISKRRHSTGRSVRVGRGMRPSRR